MAIGNRTPSGTVINSDQGVRFTSWAFTQRARDSGLVPSMGSVGDCYDNAMMESFWDQMQTELLNRRRWRSRIELANAIFEYLEVFHNRQRRHLRARHAQPHRVRTPNTDHRVGSLEPTVPTGSNPGHIRASTKPGVDQS
jgi:transposase InsO family protein